MCISNTHLHLPIHGALDLVGHLGGALVPVPGLVREKGLSALQRTEREEVSTQKLLQ